MESLINSKIYWILPLLTIIGEFIVPLILSKFYKNYNSKYMIMSVLGNKKSPVRIFYNIWLIWLGILLIITSIFLFEIDKSNNLFLAILELISIFNFGLGAGIISGIFSVNENKSEETTSSKIHGIASALGFLLLLFLPLIKGLLSFENYIIIGIIDIIAFIFALIFFVLFIMSDKERFRDTIISYEGLWQRLTLVFMYLPLICETLLMIIK